MHKRNRSDVAKLMREIHDKYPQKTIWLYTGYEWNEIKDLPLMDFVDVVVDGKFVQKLFDAKLKWRGSANQRVIDVKESKRLGKVVLLTE